MIGARAKTLHNLVMKGPQTEVLKHRLSAMPRLTHGITHMMLALTLLLTLTHICPPYFSSTCSTREQRYRYDIVIQSIFYSHEGCWLCEYIAHDNRIQPCMYMTKDRGNEIVNVFMYQMCADFWVRLITNSRDGLLTTQNITSHLRANIMLQFLDCLYNIDGRQERKICVNDTPLMRPYVYICVGLPRSLNETRNLIHYRHDLTPIMDIPYTKYRFLIFMFSIYLRLSETMWTDAASYTKGTFPEVAAHWTSTGTTFLPSNGLMISEACPSSARGRALAPRYKVGEPDTKTEAPDVLGRCAATGGTVLTPTSFSDFRRCDLTISKSHHNLFLPVTDNTTPNEQCDLICDRGYLPPCSDGVIQTIGMASCGRRNHDGSLLMYELILCANSQHDKHRLVYISQVECLFSIKDVLMLLQHKETQSDYDSVECLFSNKEVLMLVQHKETQSDYGSEERNLYDLVECLFSNKEILMLVQHKETQNDYGSVERNLYVHIYLYILRVTIVCLVYQCSLKLSVPRCTKIDIVRYAIVCSLLEPTLTTRCTYPILKGRVCPPLSLSQMHDNEHISNNQWHLPANELTRLRSFIILFDER